MPVKAAQLVFCRNESVSAGLKCIVDELIKRAIVRQHGFKAKVRTCDGSLDSPTARSAGPRPESLRSEPR
jgi:hypothetical protein